MYKPSGGQPVRHPPNPMVRPSVFAPLLASSRYPYPSEPAVRYPTPTAAQIAYPGLYQHPAETFRVSESEYRSSDHARKRPSMLSNFGMGMGSHHVVYNSGDNEGTSAKRMRSGSRGDQTEASEAVQMAARKEPAYTPQVENISPTPDDQPQQQQASDKIVEKITKIEREITIVETQMNYLRKKQELEEKSMSGDDAAEADRTGQSLFDKIYAENRKKAASAHAKFAHLFVGGRTAFAAVPLYHEPWDVPAIREQIKRHEEFKPRLILHLKKLQRARKLKEKYLTDRYNQYLQVWKKKVERIESNAKRKAREAKYRELFEKVFPEIRKHREEKERSTRIETRSGMLSARYEAEQMTFTKTDDEEDEKRIRQNAVVVPIMIDARSRQRYQYINRNGLVKDPSGEHSDRLKLFHQIWSPDEKQIFREKFIQYGKNFGAIAFFLEKKTPRDCVQYYYLTKKRENFKLLLRRRRGNKPSKIYRPPVMPRQEDLAPRDESQDEAPAAEAPAEPEYHCVICKSKIDSTAGGRILTRACYDHYGLDRDQDGTDLRICQKCYMNFVRKRQSQYAVYCTSIACPVGTCTAKNRKVKPNRSLPPPRWTELDQTQKDYLSKKLQLEGASKCCASCLKRITARVDAVLSGAETISNKAAAAASDPAEWSEDQVDKLKEALGKHGWEDWGVVAEWVEGRSPDECRAYFDRHKDTPAFANITEMIDANGNTKVQGIESEEEENGSSEVDTAMDESSRAPTPCPTTTTVTTPVTPPTVTAVTEPVAMINDQKPVITSAEEVPAASAAVVTEIAALAVTEVAAVAVTEVAAASVTIVTSAVAAPLITAATISTGLPSAAASSLPSTSIAPETPVAMETNEATPLAQEASQLECSAPQRNLFDVSLEIRGSRESLKSVGSAGDNDSNATLSADEGQTADEKPPVAVPQIPPGAAPTVTSAAISPRFLASTAAPVVPQPQPAKDAEAFMGMSSVQRSLLSGSTGKHGGAIAPGMLPVCPPTSRVKTEPSAGQMGPFPTVQATVAPPVAAPQPSAILAPPREDKPIIWPTSETSFAAESKPKIQLGGETRTVASTVVPPKALTMPEARPKLPSVVSSPQIATNAMVTGSSGAPAIIVRRQSPTVAAAGMQRPTVAAPPRPAPPVMVSVATATPLATNSRSLVAQSRQMRSPAHPMTSASPMGRMGTPSGAGRHGIGSISQGTPIRSGVPSGISPAPPPSLVPSEPAAMRAATPHFHERERMEMMKEDRPASSDAVRRSPAPIGGAGGGSLAAIQHQQAMLERQIYARSYYQQARNMGLNEEQCLTSYYRALASTPGGGVPVGTSGASRPAQATSQPPPQQESSSTSSGRQIMNDFLIAHGLSVADTSKQEQIMQLAAAQQLPKEYMHLLDPTQAAMLQQHLYGRVPDQPRSLLEQQQRLAAAAALDQQQRVALYEYHRELDRQQHTQRIVQALAEERERQRQQMEYSYLIAEAHAQAQQMANVATSSAYLAQQQQQQQQQHSMMQPHQWSKSVTPELRTDFRQSPSVGQSQSPLTRPVSGSSASGMQQLQQHLQQQLQQQQQQQASKMAHLAHSAAVASGNLRSPSPTVGGSSQRSIVHGVGRPQTQAEAQYRPAPEAHLGGNLPRFSASSTSATPATTSSSPSAPPMLRTKAAMKDFSPTINHPVGREALGKPSSHRYDAAATAAAQLSQHGSRIGHSSTVQSVVDAVVGEFSAPPAIPKSRRSVDSVDSVIDAIITSQMTTSTTVITPSPQVSGGWSHDTMAITSSSAAYGGAVRAAKADVERMGSAIRATVPSPQLVDAGGKSVSLISRIEDIITEDYKGPIGSSGQPQPPGPPRIVVSQTAPSGDQANAALSAQPFAASLSVPSSAFPVAPMKVPPGGAKAGPGGHSRKTESGARGGRGKKSPVCKPYPYDYDLEPVSSPEDGSEGSASSKLKSGTPIPPWTPGQPMTPAASPAIGSPAPPFWTILSIPEGGVPTGATSVSASVSLSGMAPLPPISTEDQDESSRAVAALLDTQKPEPSLLPHQPPQLTVYYSPVPKGEQGGGPSQGQGQGVKSTSRSSSSLEMSTGRSGSFSGTPLGPGPPKDNTAPLCTDFEPLSDEDS